MRLAIIIPTYNESENIQLLIQQILAQKLEVSLRVIIVDDASPDGTGAIVDQLARVHSEVTCIHRRAKLGLGSAYRDGFIEALNSGSEAIITMDADFSHNPAYLPALIAASRSAALVIGCRYISGGGTKGWSTGRRFLSATANLFARTMLRLTTHDATAGFRCYRREVFTRIPVSSIHSEGYSFQIEMTARCEHAGLPVAEVPILFENRTRGASKISRREVWQGVFTVMRLFIKGF